MNDALVLDAATVRRSLNIDTCIHAVERAFRELGLGRTAPPATMAVRAQEGIFHIKAGILRTDRREYYAAKSNGNFPGNPKSNGLPTIQGVVILCDAANGRVLALLDSMELTAKRTAAATGVAARYLARPHSHTVTICGCGIQAPAQLEAVVAVLPIEAAYVFDVDREKADRFAARMSATLGIPIEPMESLGAAVRLSDVCVTCTTSRDFVLQPEHARPGMLIAGVGVDSEDKRELAPGLLARAAVVTDLTTQCAEIGDLHHAIAAGAMTHSDVHAELGAVVAGHRPGRTRDDQLFVFDSTGLALQDVAAAAAIFELLEDAAQPGEEM